VLSAQNGHLMFFVRVGTLSGWTDVTEDPFRFHMFEDPGGIIPDAYIDCEIGPRHVRFTVPRVGPWTVTLVRYHPESGTREWYTFTGGDGAT
jgi:hypothetical protein